MGGLDRLARFAIAHVPSVLALALLALIPSLYAASKLIFESSLTALLPAQYQAVQDLRAGEALSGGAAYAVVAIGAKDRALAERYALAVHDRLAELPEVRFVQSRIDVDFVKQHQLLFLSTDSLDEIVEEVTDEIDARAIDSAGLGLGLEQPDETMSLDLNARFEKEAKEADLPTAPFLYGRDGRYLYVFAALSGEAGDLGTARVTQSTFESTCLALRDEGGFPKDLEIRFSGSMVIRLEDNAILIRDLERASALGFFAVVLLLVVYTRRFRTLILLGVPLLCGLAATLAFAQLTFGRLNIISGFLVSILSGLGIEFGIHLLLRHLEERGRGLDPEAAQRASMQTTGRSLLGSAGTNAGAFFVVSFAGFEGFSEFGLIAGVGLILTLVLTLLIFPALNMTLERIRPIRVPKIARDGKDGLVLPSWMRWVVLVGLPLLFVYSIVALARGDVKFRTNWREIKGESPASDFDDYIVQSLGQTFTQTLVFVKSNEELPKVRATIDAVVARRRSEGRPNGVTGTLSVADLVPPDQDARLERIAALRKQLLRLDPQRLEPTDRERLQDALSITEVGGFGLADLPTSLVQRFKTTTGDGSLMIVRTDYDFYESSQVVDWAEEMTEIHDELARRGLEAPIVSENWVAGTVFQIIYKDGPFVLGGTFLVVFLVILLDMRRIRRAAIVLGSLLLGFVSIAGGMSLVGLELNFINSAVLPLVIGVSIDNAVHIYHRYLEEGPGSIPTVLRYTVSATTLSSAANLMGFGSMIIAHHRGLRSVAELAILGIALTFLSTSVFFPLVLGAIGARRSRAGRAAVADRDHEPGEG